ncbi:PREDICTED: VIN3-like protein 1 [Tarenaya hassleriana]|uniref:VIN3-like protein 1 n=1 Tax=Tarenaya hassleriana TaxID=28532 RepID=UPI00053C4D0B|nr:PREDICTED: VIN3-like protein 1 [Tarenaya hassleriana]
MADSSKKTKKVARKTAINAHGSTSENPEPSDVKRPSNKKRSRKPENPKPLREQQPLGPTSDANPRVCANAACRKVQSEVDKFCRRCSCCICGTFDENKDTSKWLECSNQSGESESERCGLSCHVECALEKNEVGVIYHGPLMQLDGGYRCRFCGTISGIIQFWKKQLVIAKTSRRLDTLAYKINLSCRLLDGTLKFKELHEIVKDAKAKLDSEIGPTDMESASKLHGLVGRLSVAAHIRKSCSLAIGKADELLAHPSGADPVIRAHGCNFVCDEVTFSSVRITVFGLIPAMAPQDGLKGYKLWYYKTRGETRPEEPTRVIPVTQKTVTITGLQPSTEYIFCVAAYSEAGEWGHSETACVTKGFELAETGQSHMGVETDTVRGKEPENATEIDSDRVRKLAKLFRQAVGDMIGSSSKRVCRAGDMEEQVTDRPSNSGGQNLLSEDRSLDLNIVTVPDLNKEMVLAPTESSKGGQVNEPGKFLEEIENNGASNDQEDQGFQITVGNVTTTDFLKNMAENSKDDGHESNTNLSGQPLPLSQPREDENLEHCIRMIRKLEREGHISSDFRLKFLTWFCLRSSQYQCRLVRLFIDAFAEDPDQLAKQLAHSFPDIVSPSKKPKNG